MAAGRVQILFMACQLACHQLNLSLTQSPQHTVRHHLLTFPCSVHSEMITGTVK
uniref:Uncharacterized protein n=1 Tax=Arundo donax TaxID=35708 RepID=A0A0A9E4Y8_ARUDO